MSERGENRALPVPGALAVDSRRLVGPARTNPARAKRQQLNRSSSRAGDRLAPALPGLTLGLPGRLGL